MDLRVIQCKTQLIGHMTDFEQHEHHRHDQQQNAGHRAGKPVISVVA
jgi:hypothetical protein